MRTPDLVGKYEAAHLSGETIALRGNLKLGIFAGLLTGPFVRVR